METQIMVERPSIFFINFFKKLTRFWPLNWRGCFGQGIKWDAPSWVWTLGFAFGGFTLCPAEGFNSYILLAIPRPLNLDGHSVKQP
jgi:hypothetical protein